MKEPEVRPDDHSFPPEMFEGYFEHTLGTNHTLAVATDNLPVFLRVLAESLGKFVALDCKDAEAAYALRLHLAARFTDSLNETLALRDQKPVH